MYPPRGKKEFSVSLHAFTTVFNIIFNFVETGLKRRNESITCVTKLDDVEDHVCLNEKYQITRADRCNGI